MTEHSVPLSKDEKTRYARQIMIPEIGEAGQQKLKLASVLIAGVGGLGSISSYYLTAAGIGNIRIVDSDTVELSNLNRQIIHSEKDLNKAKTKSASEKLKHLNRSINLEQIKSEINKNTIHVLTEGIDIIVDATDNIETRKQLNFISLKKKIPYIFGGVKGFDGMITTFIPGKTPCMECIFPSLERKQEKPGVIGPVPGLIASLQCMEVIKLILGEGDLLAGRLLQIRSWNMRIKEIHIKQNPDCTMCA